ncbi:MAG: cupin domain-containing protein [Acidobacteriota bacterium]
MSNPFDETIEFDDGLALALAESVDLGEGPRPDVKARLLARLAETAHTGGLPPVPEGFSFSFANEGWQPYPLPGIRLKVLAIDRARDCATILIEAAAGARFPAHHHGGAEECYVISGDAHSLGRRLGPGDFIHADAGTDHDELYTEGGATVLLVVRPEDYIPGYVRDPKPTAPPS